MAMGPVYAGFRRCLGPVKSHRGRIGGDRTENRHRYPG